MRISAFLLANLLWFSGVAAQSAVNWLSWDEAMALHAKEPRKLMVDVYTDWCGWCKVMDSKTFSNEVVSDFLNEKFYAVKLNAEQREDISFQGKTFRYVAQGNRGYHELAAALLNNQLSFPSVVILDEKVNMLQLIPGFRKAKEFDIMLKYFGTDAFRNQTWEVFQAGYQSPVVE